MRNEKQIIAELKDCINRSKPFRLYTPVMALLNELDSKFQVEEEPVVEGTIEEPIVEETGVDTEQNVLVKNEEGIFEEITLGEEIVEEPQTDDLIVETIIEESPVTEEPFVAKKSTKKK